MIRTASILLALAISGPALGQTAPTAVSPESQAVFEEFFDEALLRVRAEADEGDSGAAFALARGLLADNLDPAAQAEGVIYLEKAADAGIVDAQVQLAGLLRSGAHGLPLDPQRALDLLEKAAATGDNAALVALGSLALDTQLGVAGRDRAVGLLNKAAEAGDVNAANLLGGLYAQGRGVPLDPERAKTYYEIGVVAGSSASIAYIGDLLRTGAGPIAADPKKAMVLYEVAAVRGNQGAARRIADMYLRGEGVPSSPDEAVQMLTDLAIKGDPQAYLALADYYLRGEIIPVDIEKARSYLDKSVAAGNPTALLRLGDLYRNGAPGLTADVGKAIEYYNRAIELGAPSAERYLANVYLDLAQPAANPARGIELLKVAAVKGDATAAIRLGDLYSVNDLVQADYDTSKSYFEMALGFGNANAAIDFAQALVAGPLGTAHRDEALTLLKGAVESGLPGASAELARLQLAGTFPGHGLDGVLTMLLDATRKGDAAAARYLLQLYREGYGLVLAPDRAAAENLLSTLEPVLGPEGVALERILLAAPGGSTDANLVAISDEFAKLSRANGLVVLQQLRNSNAHAYVYIVQTRLKERGLYTGPLHGTLDSRTIGAMRAACEQVGATRACDAGPLTNGAVQVIGNFLFDPPIVTAPSQG